MKVVAILNQSTGDGYGHGLDWQETAIFDTALPMSAVLD